MVAMMSLRRLSTSSKVYFFPSLDCSISIPETETPPALLALPGEYMTLFLMKSSLASSVQGIFAPSNTPIHPFLINIFASFSSSSN